MHDDDEIELGRLGANGGRFGTERDIRAALEDRSTDPILSAFGLLVAPSKPWLAKVLDEDERRELGDAALAIYGETLSTAPCDYEHLLNHVADPFAYEWSHLRPLAPSPCGYRS